MIISDSGAKRIENTDNWRDIFADHNGTVDALDRVTADLAPIIKGNTCAAGAAAGDYVLLCGSTITGKDDGAYIAAKAIPANTAIDATYLGTALDGGIANSLNSNMVNKDAIKNDLSTSTSGYVLDARAGRTLKLLFDALSVATLLYTFTGTGSTSVTLAANAMNYAFLMAFVTDNSGVIGTAFVNPTISHNRDIKICCGSTTVWGSFKLTDNGAKCTFNRTTSGTTSVLFYGVGAKSL